jgi:hypothetical protein
MSDDLLRRLAEDPAAHQGLLEDSGCLAAAAYRLARAKAQSTALWTDVPSALEVHAAAHVIAERTGLPAVPHRKLLAAECRALGLEVT